ncbi:hypothetical protein ACFQU2_08325 [Siccirubricoccus deserti]
MARAAGRAAVRGVVARCCRWAAARSAGGTGLLWGGFGAGRRGADQDTECQGCSFTRMVSPSFMPPFAAS